jgi:hypothetical protein
LINSLRIRPVHRAAGPPSQQISGTC